MILHQFPDLTWLKAQIAARFAERQRWDGTPLESSGFPNVIIETEISHHHRSDIVGPFSLFINLSGESVCEVERRKTLLPMGYFFASNPAQTYSLEYQEAAHTFNIHFGESFFDEVISGQAAGTAQLLENPFAKQGNSFHFHNRLYPTSEAIYQWIANARLADGFSGVHLQEQLYELFLLIQPYQQKNQQQTEQLNSLKPATKTELFRRLSQSVDYLYAHFQTPFTLEELAQEAAMSKYHFLRLFKLAFGQTPTRFAGQLKLQKAKDLLQTTSLSVVEISELLGFESPNSFSRFFHKHCQCAPSFYRLETKPSISKIAISDRSFA